MKSNGLSAFYTQADLQRLAQTIANKVDFHQLAARCVTIKRLCNPLSMPISTLCYMHYRGAEQAASI